MPKDGKGSSGKAEASGPSESLIEIKVKNLRGGNFVVRVPPECSVVQFREVVVKASGGPPNQRIIFRGKVLKDEKKITDYGLQSGLTVHLVGAPPPRRRAATGAATGTSAASGREGGMPRM
eukprot:146119-Amorphochlora_amoeboformis.AAC.1